MYVLANFRINEGRVVVDVSPVREVANEAVRGLGWLLGHRDRIARG